jgi:hypothetical protein
MSQAPPLGARPLRVLADVQAVLAGLCQTLHDSTVQPTYPEVIKRARRNRVLALDLPARAFNPLDRPFLALDHIMTSRITGVFMDLGCPAGGPNNFGTMTEQVIGPIRLLHSTLKGDLLELIRYLLLVDLQSQLDKQGEQIRRACADLQSVLPQ